MYLNTFLFQFGLDPDNFVNEVIEPFESDKGTIIYNLQQRTDVRICPICGCVDAEINNYSWTETNFTANEGRPIIIRIKKVRFKCQGCGKTYTPTIKGIERYSKISKQIETLIVRDFYKQKSFALIGDAYRLTRSDIIKIFDRNFIYVRKGQLPIALCID
jgi:transposase